MQRKALTALIVISVAASAGAEYRGGYILCETEEFTMRLNGRIQTRYEYYSPSAGEDLSSFYLRRVRLDFRGSAFESGLRFRIMPELSRIANLRDGWMEYQLNGSAAVRAGQMTVPFQRQRDISGFRQHFTERSIPSESFGVPGGYDIGVALLGVLPGGLRYSAGVFDGYGRNKKESNSNGNLASLRLTRAVSGTAAADESDRRVSEIPNLTLGLGLQGATKNELRDWSLERSGSGRADYSAAAADIHLAWRGFSCALDYYLRSVLPESSGSYTGRGFLSSAGYLIGGRYEVVARYSDQRLDVTDEETSSNQLGVGLNIYHRQHNHKTRLNYFRDKDSSGVSGTFLVESHLSF